MWLLLIPRQASWFCITTFCDWLNKSIATRSYTLSRALCRFHVFCWSLMFDLLTGLSVPFSPARVFTFDSGFFGTRLKIALISNSFY